MIKTTLTAVTAAALALGFAASTAFAQTPAPAAPGATKARAATTAAPKAKAPTKVASACKGLAEANCKGNTSCAWIVPKKANAKTGKVPASYCRVLAGVAKTAAQKKAAATPAPTVTAAKPAAAAPKKPRVVKAKPAAKPPAAAAGAAPKTQ